ncbi:MAG: hypothetical protein J7L44_00120 [Candidatus Diapherotrites archaeon]|nr:hypothetical protein [Candidatus Diapherotrites archaeon]
MNTRKMLIKKPQPAFKVSRESRLSHLKKKRLQVLASKLRPQPHIRIVEAADVKELERKINRSLAQGYLLDRIDMLTTDFFRSYLALLVYEPEEDE